MVNLLPLREGERITRILPLPEDESAWQRLQVVFATKSGNVRRNQLSDFKNVHKTGKIAMKLGSGDGIVGVQICTVKDDVLLTTRGGKCVRFPASEIRVFKGRESTGVRGIRLAKGDEVVSLSLLKHSDANTAEARAYLKQASAARRAAGEADAEAIADADEEPEEAAVEVVLTPITYAELGAREQFVLSVSERGFGKRTSSYEYRVTRRGGSGITAMAMSKRNGPVVAAFPVEEGDHLMMITDQGQTIRVPVASVRIAGRATQGVTLFRLEEGERVVSVERIAENENGNGQGE
jgi:DNA gyrase subunit A